VAIAMLRARQILRFLTAAIVLSPNQARIWEASAWKFLIATEWLAVKKQEQKGPLAQVRWPLPVTQNLLGGRTA